MDSPDDGCSQSLDLAEPFGLCENKREEGLTGQVQFSITDMQAQRYDLDKYSRRVGVILDI